MKYKFIQKSINREPFNKAVLVKEIGIGAASFSIGFIIGWIIDKIIYSIFIKTGKDDKKIKYLAFLQLILFIITISIASRMFNSYVTNYLFRVGLLLSQTFLFRYFLDSFSHKV